MFAATAMPAAYNRCWVGANGLPCNRCVGSTDGTRSDDALFVPLAAVRFVYSTSDFSTPSLRLSFCSLSFLKTFENLRSASSKPDGPLLYPRNI